MNDAERFWRKVYLNGPGGCMIWTGAKTQGYGRFHLNGTVVMAHRFAYELVVGHIPDGNELDHLCRVPDCVNPRHLVAVDHRTNIRLRKGGLSD